MIKTKFFHGFFIHVRASILTLFVTATLHVIVPSEWPIETLFTGWTLGCGNVFGQLGRAQNFDVGIRSYMISLIHVGPKGSQRVDAFWSRIPILRKSYDIRVPIFKIFADIITVGISATGVSIIVE